MKRILVALSPQKTIERGYSITRNSAGNIIKHASDISVGEEVVTTLAKGNITSVVRTTSS